MTMKEDILTYILMGLLLLALALVGCAVSPEYRCVNGMVRQAYKPGSNWEDKMYQRFESRRSFQSHYILTPRR